MSTFGDSENGINAGAAHVGHFDGSKWVVEQKLVLTDGQEMDRFGYGAGISDGTIIISAVTDDDNGEDSGSAYVFRHNGTEWFQTQKIIPANREHDNHFGTCVSVSGNLCVISAFDWLLQAPSQVYVFRFDGYAWIEEDSLTFPQDEVGEMWGALRVVDFPEGARDYFAVAASGDDEAGENAGAAYLFGDDSGEWSIEKKILPPDAEDGLRFGDQIAYTEDVLAVSAPGQDSQDGCIYIYRQWSYSFYATENPLPEQKLTIPQQDKDKAFGFGTCLAVDGNTLITTAFRIIDDDPQHCDGIVYIYEYNGSVWVLTSRIEAFDSRQEIVFYGPSFWPVAVDGDVAMLGAHGNMWGPGMTYMYRRCPTADVNGDCFVNLADFSVLAQEWLTGFHPWPRW